MPISHEHRCVFVHIPKTAGTSIEQALGMYGNWEVEDRHALFGLISSGILLDKGFLSSFLQHLTYPQILSLYQKGEIADYFSFSVVRNPWDRMVSAYSSLDTHLISTARAQGIDLERLTFAEFLEQSTIIKHIHLLPQHEFITDDSGRQLVDFIGRFETFTTDFALICDRLGVNSALPHANRSVTRKDFDYRQYYSRKSRRLIEEIYAMDIELFGYRF